MPKYGSGGAGGPSADFGLVTYRWGNTTPQTLTTATLTVIGDTLMDTEDFNELNLSWDGTNERYTIGEDGLYRLIAYLQWDTGSSPASGHHQLQIQLASVTYSLVYAPYSPMGVFEGEAGLIDFVDATVPLNAGATVRVRAIQTSGGNLDVDDCELAILRCN